MIAAEIAMGLLMHQYFGGHTGDTVPHHIGIAIIAVVCIFVAGFAWSWGPLAWLVRTLQDLTPLSCRSGTLEYKPY